MPFKLHLIIVSFIIVAVYAAWQWMNKQPSPAAQHVQTADPVYTIDVIHASWGLNCNSFEMSSEVASDDAYMRKRADIKKPYADNVLAVVSKLCNGKVRCSIPLNKTTLGDDPAPKCAKALDVEYRCFSYDRPWIVSASSGSLALKCEALAK